MSDQDPAGGAVTPPSGSGAVNPAPGSGAVNAEMRAEIQRILAGQFKEMVPRIVKAAIAESLTPAALRPVIEPVLEAMAQTDEPTPAGTPTQPAAAGAGGGASAPNPEVEALRKQLAEHQKQQEQLRKLIEERDRAAKEASEKMTRIEVRAAAKAALASAIGADSPVLDPLLSHYADRFKRTDDGQFAMAFRREGFDEPEWKPIADGIKEWAAGEGKVYVPAQPSRLPTAYGMPYGQAARPHAPTGNGGQRINPILHEAGLAMQTTDPTGANALLQASTVAVPRSK